MPKTISATEAKDNFGSLFAWVDKQSGVIIERRGKPRAVLVSYDTYKRIEELKEQVERHQALAKLNALAAKVQQRNQDLAPGEAKQLADRFVEETVNEMVEEGKVSFVEVE